MFDVILFGVFPYVAFTILFVASLWRYFKTSYKFSSLSSEFLESNQLFWGSVPWHYGILVVLLGHFVAFLFPKEILVWNSMPIRLVILEVTGLIFGLMAFVGLVMLIVRRLTNDYIQAVTSKMDILVLVLLLIQVLTGIGNAVFLRWGSSWYAAAMAPYLWSLLKFNPNIEYVVGIHWVAKIHILNAFVLVGILSFTRLVHFLILPIWYLWRPTQLVIWNADQRKIRKSQRRT